MSANRYAPPASPVHDIQQAPVSLQRPPIATVGIVLLWLQIAVSVGGVAYSLVEVGLIVDGQFGWMLELLAPCGFAALLALFTWKAGLGRHWARVAHLVFLVVSLLMMLASYVMLHQMLGGEARFFEPVSLAWMLGENLLATSGVVLLFTAQANDWYRAMRAARLP
jgi:hypothetical protein